MDDPIMLRSEHHRILASAQERYDDRLGDVKSNALAWGLLCGVLLGIVLGVGAVISLITTGA